MSGKTRNEGKHAMHTPFTDAYDKTFLLETMMGPNAMRITEELTSWLPMRAGLRILDLGCGMGISSILLAGKHGATVFAADLWIAPTDNFRRFEALGLSQLVIPLSVDATKALPFAEGYFDMIVCVDAYQYFGADPAMLPRLMTFVKPGGHIAVAACGLKEGFPEDYVPPELESYWQPDMNFHSLSWWRALWAGEPGVVPGHCREMDCLRRAWDDWLESPNPYAQRDIPMMRAEAGKYFALVQLIGRKR